MLRSEGTELGGVSHALTKEAVEACPNTLSRVCRFWAACAAAASTAVMSPLPSSLPLSEPAGAGAGLGAAGGGGLGGRTLPSAANAALATT